MAAVPQFRNTKFVCMCPDSTPEVKDGRAPLDDPCPHNVANNKPAWNTTSSVKDLVETFAEFGASVLNCLKKA